MGCSSLKKWTSPKIEGAVEKQLSRYALTEADIYLHNLKFPRQWQSEEVVLSLERLPVMIVKISSFVAFILEIAVRKRFEIGRIVAGIILLVGFSSLVYYQLSGLKLHFFHESAYPLLYAETNIDTHTLFSSRFSGREISPISWPLVGSLLLLMGGKVSIGTHSVLAVLFSIFALAIGYLYCRVSKLSFYTTVVFLILIFINFGPVPSRYLWTDQVWVWPMNSYGVYDFFSLACLTTVIALTRHDAADTSTPSIISAAVDLAKNRILIFACIIFFLMGLNGVRGFLVISAPVIFAFGFEYALKKDPFSQSYYKPWLTLTFIVAASAISVLLITILTRGVPQPWQDPHKIVTVHNWVELRDRISSMLYTWLSLFNAIPLAGESIFSVANRTKVFNSVFALVILILPFVRIGKINADFQRPERMATYRYFFIFLLLVVATGYGDSATVPRYLLPLAFAALFVTPFYFESWIKEKRYGIALIFCALLVPAYINSVVALTSYSLSDYKSNKFYRLGKFLEENGLKYGYAGPWNTGVLTTIHFTDGRVRIALVDPLFDPMPLQPHRHADKKWFDPKNFTGPTFLALPGASKASNKKARELSKKATKTLTFEDWIIDVFPYNIAGELENPL